VGTEIIGLRIRRITVVTKSSEINYFIPDDGDRRGRSTEVDLIVQDAEAWKLHGKSIYNLYKTDNGSMRCWKTVVDVPCIIEYYK